jgi:hypothetical protein
MKLRPVLMSQRIIIFTAELSEDCISFVKEHWRDELHELERGQLCPRVGCDTKEERNCPQITQGGFRFVLPQDCLTRIGSNQFSRTKVSALQLIAPAHSLRLCG